MESTYKGNRTKRKPAGYAKLKKWAMSTWKSVMKPGLEADDALGIVATQGNISNFVLVSPDKDMEQIPCRLYNLKREFTQTPEDAERKLYVQCLTGDSTDGYSDLARRLNVLILFWIIEQAVVGRPVSRLSRPPVRPTTTPSRTLNGHPLG